MSALLTFALDENNNRVNIDSVKNGVACKCICPDCKNPLIAKNGGIKRAHHFSHFQGITCESANETAFHLLAKEVIMEEKRIMLPERDSMSFPSGLVHLHDIKQETWDEQFQIRPDLEAIMENGERLLIEIYVSHKIPRRKHDVILANNLKCIEIDLNWVELDKSAIRKFLLEDTVCRKWVTKYEGNKSKGDGNSLGGRNPLHEKAIEFIKDKFDKETLKIGFKDVTYDLKNWGYDVCERKNYYFRNFKIDLLLTRSKKKDKGEIAISFRGRKRNKNKEKPSGSELRVIDVIIRNQNDLEGILTQESLCETSTNIIFKGFKLNQRPNDGPTYN